jgi:pyruvate/2-oxoglutarate dehydrogenase complex dihydrolipoamide acyltransferase (E2) component
MDVVLPKWGVTMQEGTIAEWLVGEGDTVEEDQPLAHVVTDKVDADIEAPVAGVLTKQCVAKGDVVEVGAVVAIIEEG